MARRRVKSNALSPLFVSDAEEDTSYDPAMVYADPSEYSPEVLQNIFNIGSLAEGPETYEKREIPPLPYMPQEREQELPIGLQLLADYADIEAQEDGLDVVADSMPPIREDLASLGLDEAVPDTAPQGLELVGDLAETEAEEDALDEFSETEPQFQQPVPSEMEGGELPPAVIEAAQKGPLDEVTEADIPTEGLGAVPGAVETASKDARAIKTIENLLRLKGVELDPYMMEYAKTAEGAITKRREELNEQEKAFKERLDIGQMSNIDITALGMALVIPAILSLFMGPGALLGAISGIGEGIVEAQKARQKDVETAQKGLEGIAKERQQLEEKHLKLTQELMSKERNPKLRALFDQYDIIGEPSPEGYVQLGSDAQAFEEKGTLKIGLRGGDEEEVLWYDTNRLRGDEDRAVLDKKLEDGRDVIRQLSEAETNVGSIVDLLSAIEEQDPSIYKVIRSTIAQALPDQNMVDVLSREGSRVSIRLQNPDGSFSEVDAIPILAQNIDMLMDTYRTGFLPGTRYSSAFEQHWKSVFSDPKDIQSWLSQDVETMRSKARIFESQLNDRMIGTLVKDGFIRKPLEQRFSTKRSVPVSESAPRQEARNKILQDTETMKALITE